VILLQRLKAVLVAWAAKYSGGIGHVVRKVVERNDPEPNKKTADKKGNMK
jgi:hypothetical protein